MQNVNILFLRTKAQPSASEEADFHITELLNWLSLACSKNKPTLREGALSRLPSISARGETHSPFLPMIVLKQEWKCCWRGGMGLLGQENHQRRFASGGILFKKAKVSISVAVDGTTKTILRRHFDGKSEQQPWKDLPSQAWVGRSIQVFLGILPLLSSHPPSACVESRLLD